MIRRDLEDKFMDPRQFSERGLELLSGKAHLPREPLEEIHGIFAFLEREIPVLLERYKQKHEEKRTTNRVSQE